MSIRSSNFIKCLDSNSSQRNSCSTQSTSCLKFSAKNYKNLDPIKKPVQLLMVPVSDRDEIDVNVNILTSTKLPKAPKLMSKSRSKSNLILSIDRILVKKTTKIEPSANTNAPLSALVGSKLLSSVKDLRKSFKSLIETNTNTEINCKTTRIPIPIKNRYFRKIKPYNLDQACTLLINPQLKTHFGENFFFF